MYMRKTVFVPSQNNHASHFREVNTINAVMLSLLQGYIEYTEIFVRYSEGGGGELSYLYYSLTLHFYLACGGLYG